jgi:hypothetical protein
VWAALCRLPLTSLALPIELDAAACECIRTRIPTLVALACRAAADHPEDLGGRLAHRSDAAGGSGLLAPVLPAFPALDLPSVRTLRITAWRCSPLWLLVALRSPSLESLAIAVDCERCDSGVLSAAVRILGADPGGGSPPSPPPLSTRLRELDLSGSHLDPSFLAIGWLHRLPALETLQCAAVVGDLRSGACSPVRRAQNAAWLRAQPPGACNVAPPLWKCLTQLRVAGLELHESPSLFRSCPRLRVFGAPDRLGLVALAASVRGLNELERLEFGTLDSIGPPPGPPTWTDLQQLLAAAPHLRSLHTTYYHFHSAQRAALSRLAPRLTVVGDGVVAFPDSSSV